MVDTFETSDLEYDQDRICRLFMFFLLSRLMYHFLVTLYANQPFYNEGGTRMCPWDTDACADAKFPYSHKAKNDIFR